VRRCRIAAEIDEIEEFRRQIRLAIAAADAAEAEAAPVVADAVVERRRTPRHARSA
jgi:hypothetical protein